MVTGKLDLTFVLNLLNFGLDILFCRFSIYIKSFIMLIVNKETYFLCVRVKRLILGPTKFNSAYYTGTYQINKNVIIN